MYINQIWVFGSLEIIYIFKHNIREELGKKTGINK